MTCWHFEAAEKQFYEMHRHLGLVHKEVNNYRDIVNVDFAEAKSCRELLSRVQDVAESNRS